jgi:uncharacterized membrane protein
LRDTVTGPMRPFLALLVFLAFAGPAQAGFNLCNRTAHPAKVALGRFNGTDWMSEGWWTVLPGQCSALIGEKLKARYYYLYADTGGDSWEGTRGFCVAQSDKFSVIGRADCAGRGYDRKLFFMVDTGQKLDYTQFLSD